MDRYNEVKLQLKRWEQSFVTQNQRKPNKEDIDEAPEETRTLYKEFRSLKQAKENSSSDGAGSRHAASVETSRAQTEPDAWGAHLNRSALPASSPKLTSSDRDSLKSSSQYYALKLKNNLATLGKERPISLKKSKLPGRLPLNTLKEKTAALTNNTKTTISDSETSPFTPRRSQPCLTSPISKAFHQNEPEKLFEPFKHVKKSPNEPVDAAYGGTSNSFSEGANVSSSTVGSLNLLSSLLPKCDAADLKINIRLAEIQHEIAETGSESRAGVETPSCSDSPSDGVSPEFKGRLFGGSEGGKLGSGGRPSPASRLGFINRKWLERCQVFGEMGSEDRPGGGNKEIQGDVGEGESKKEEETLQEEKKIEEELNADRESGGNECLVKIKKREKTPKSVQRNTGKSHDGEEVKGKRKKEQIESSPKSENTKRRGKKRRREGEDKERDPCEEGAEKKRRRKQKEEDSEVPSDTAKKRRNRKNRKEEDDEKEKTDKGTKKVLQENLLGEVEEEFAVIRKYRSMTAPTSGVPKGAEGNFVKINLKKKSHVKGYALRGMALRRQLYVQKFQLKGERFGGGGGFSGRGRRGGFRGGLSRQGDTCYKCGGSGHWAMECKGRAAPPPPTPEDQPAEEEPFELPTLEEVARATGTLNPQPLVGSSGFTDDPQKEPNNSDKDAQLLNVIRPDYERPALPPAVDPLYPLRDNGKVQVTPDEVHVALKELGYPSFRPGQEEAVMRILSGLSTLVVLSTGMGKSLCYQLPAYLYAQRSTCITLVISPLVSLMDDQLSGLPATLKAACIHSNMTMKQRMAAIEKVKSGQVCLLLLSPEALVGGGGSGSGCLPPAQEIPPVAFACIDEAHCVSEWSHNFRPCYLRLCKVLRERLGVHCLLGLTATATLSTAMDIAQHLDITDQDGIAVRSAAVPSNLNLTVSMDRDKDRALVSLLKGDRFGCLDSIIVYCTRREETTRVAAMLRTCLQGVLVKKNPQISSETQSSSAGQRKKDLARKKIRKPLKWHVEAYHAGLSGSERRQVQNNFMCGQLRIVVATVAFGMGLDKSDVRGVIHYNMPKSFESYVQEIGRAGRDGEMAHCHLFLNPEGGDLHELRRHIYADTVDYYTVKRLVQKVFPACKCKQIHQKQQILAGVGEVEDCELLEMMDVCDQKVPLTATDEKEKGEITISQKSPVRPPEENGNKGCNEGDEEIEEKAASVQCEESCDWPRERVCHTHERAIPIQQTVNTLDITEEGVETLLCYLELHPQRFVELLHTTLSVCKISCYDGPRQLQKITKICPPVAVELARRRMAGQRVETCDQLEFDVVEVADTMGWQLPLVKRGLRQLQWSTERSGGRSGIMVEFSSPSFYFRSYGDLSDNEMDRVCQFLHSRVQKQEKTQLYQLTACFNAFRSVSFPTVSSCVEVLDSSRSSHLKTLLSEYFDKRRDGEHTLTPLDLEELDKFKTADWEGRIRADVRSFLSLRSDEKFSGRAIARILHGIGSPCFPAQIYGRDRRFWRKYIQFDFNQLIRLATQEIICFK